MPKARDITGQRFGRLVAQHPTDKRIRGRVVWQLVCDCGNTHTASLGDLTHGGTESCGCRKLDLLRERSTTHGHAPRDNTQKTPEYFAWQNMLGRCYNGNRTEYHRYGGRGITVCESWRDSFETFYADMGDRPSANHTLDRIDNNAGYSKDNCRWADKKAQARNRKSNRLLTFMGITLCLQEWSEKTGICDKVIRARLRRGWSVERALTENVRGH